MLIQSLISASNDTRTSDILPPCRLSGSVPPAEPDIRRRSSSAGAPPPSAARPQRLTQHNPEEQTLRFEQNVPKCSAAAVGNVRRRDCRAEAAAEEKRSEGSKRFLFSRRKKKHFLAAKDSDSSDSREIMRFTAFSRHLLVFSSKYSFRH